MSLGKRELTDFERAMRADFERVTREPIQDQWGQTKIVNVAKQDGGAALVSRCAAEIAVEKIDWLWPGRLARGKHTCIAGEPGTGKSQLTISIVAAVTTDGEWPG
jgi:predicted ATP-dependent serine protease